MILNIITVIALTLAIIFFTIIIVKPVENFSFLFDTELKQKVERKNIQERNRNIQRNLIENDIKKKQTIDQIAEEVSKFETVLNFIRENLHNIPVCREIDLRPDLVPTCSARPLASCSLNPYCRVEGEECVNKQLNEECANILERDSEGRYTGAAQSMFVYPSVLEEIK